MSSKKRILGGLAAAVAVMIGLFLIIVAMQPNQFRVTRSAEMNAAPGVVFAQVNNFHNWEDWSPWAKLDPDAKAVFEGPESGEGAKFSWSGNDKVGAGTQTIVESKPDERIQIRLDFQRPMKATDDVEFAFKPQDEKTLVTWTMSGNKNFMSKAICLFMNMDQMVGGDFEKGLAKLKKIVEQPTDAPAAQSEQKPTASESQP